MLDMVHLEEYSAICWNLFKLTHFCDLIHLYSILQKGDELLFKCIKEFRYFRVDHLPHWLLIEKCLIDIKFLEIRTREITAAAYLVFITEVISSCQQVGSRGLFTVNNYVLELLWVD